MKEFGRLISAGYSQTVLKHTWKLGKWIWGKVEEITMEK